MKKINKLYIYGIAIGAGMLIWAIFKTNLISTILIMFLVNSLIMLDTATVPVNKRRVYKNRWTGELVGDIDEGIWWTNFFKYIVLNEDIDATKNKYELKDIPVDTRDGVRGTISAELWAWVIDAYRLKRIGLNDAKEDILSDFGTTIKYFVSTKTEAELRRIQDRFLDFNHITQINTDDTLRETLIECGLFIDGMNSNDKKYPSVRLGPFIPPKVVTDANAARLVAQKKAEADAEENREKSKRMNLILLKKILNYVPGNKMLTVNKVTRLAAQNLGLEDKLNRGELTPEEKFEISEETVAIAKREAVGLTPKKLEEMEEKAELAVNIREGRTRDINIRGKAGGMFLNEK